MFFLTMYPINPYVELMGYIYLIKSFSMIFNNNKKIIINILDRIFLPACLATHQFSTIKKLQTYNFYVKCSKILTQ